MNGCNVVEDGEIVLWEGKPRQSRIFAVQDIFVVPLSLVVAGAAVALVVLNPSVSWSQGVLILAVPAYLTVGRFFYKAILKSRTRYLVTNRRALVLHQGEIYEHQDLDGITPEITGWNHNRIVTFGDALDSTLAGSGSIGKPVGNLGLPAGRFGVRRGDGSPYPIRFYDLGASEGDRLMTVLKQRNRRPIADPDDRSEASASSAQSDRQSTLDDGEALQKVNRSTGATPFTVWLAANRWRAILLPAAVATAVSLGTAGLMNSPSKGLLPGLVAGLGSYFAYRQRFGTKRKK